LVLLAERRPTGVYNLGAESFQMLRDDLGTLIRHAGTNARVVGIPAGLAIPALRTLDKLRLSPLAPWYYLTYHKPFPFHLPRPRTESGWRPLYSNEEALISTYEWFLEHVSEAAGEGAGASTHRKPVKQGILRLPKSLS